MSDKLPGENTDTAVIGLGHKDSNNSARNSSKMSSMTQSLIRHLTSPDLLSQGQLKRLKEHKYSAEGTSLFDAPMQVFWRWLIEQIPKTIAPNTITMAGLALNILGAVILMMFSPTATEPAPGWAYITAALTLFIYQALDAIDGKQARRTQTSTPMGELFDHGCDSVSIVFVSLAFGISVQLGEWPELLFLSTVLSIIMFYTAHWQTYVSGTLHFGMFDVTESQLTLIVIFSLSAFFGPQIWAFKVLGVELKVAVFAAGIVLALISFVNYFRVILGGGGKGKDGSTVADTSVIAPALHIGFVILLAVIIKQKSRTGLYDNQPCIYLLTFGLVASKITNKLVVAHMTKSAMDLLDTVFIGPGLLFLNQYFDTPLPEHLLLWIALIYCMADLVRYAILVCLQISVNLGIYCFDITQRRPIQISARPALK
ncbi:cholinephosphotransferase 1-like [Acanthaster planci]|uniref:diacylglycerol cholinephosphotransferase n=1 Tax=Acanthaster planci TaxID=133434 RepID=A0A8B7XTW9_ACAPL|nr:cholinephosphotransferase 1-like [Acanthaster planci]XP_022083678.1 cholinephosphotransferase 1-like [Acanthaster planci]XP_022083679.1 cholinephosphotransferase 1-like [Acanthaster planci]